MRRASASATEFTEAGLDFSPDARMMALAERRDGKDSVALFECDGWTALRSFPVATEDLADLRWSPDSTVLCVIDSVLQYQVLLYPVDGACLPLTLPQTPPLTLTLALALALTRLPRGRRPRVCPRTCTC